MSHSAERKEKVCLNCNAALHGRFCHICGQENVEPRESFWNMLTHFVFDLFHFDGKFFSTLNYLLFKPGYLSQEHLRGRRADYLHPIRMYVFTSAFFFLLYFSFFQGKEDFTEKGKKDPTAAEVTQELISNRTAYTEALKLSQKQKITFISDSLNRLIRSTDSDLVILKRDTSMKGRLRSIQGNKESYFYYNPSASEYKTLYQYDSVQKALPAVKRDGFIENAFKRKNFALEEKYHGDQKAIQNAVIEKFLHSFPSILFTSLPLFALVLFVLYNRKKKYYYSDHLVYTLHLYCAVFIILLISMTSTAALELISHKGGNTVSIIFSILIFVYWYKSIRNFYHQSRKRTLLKFTLLFWINLFIMLVLFILFFLISAMTTH